MHRSYAFDGARINGTLEIDCLNRGAHRPQLTVEDTFIDLYLEYEYSTGSIIVSISVKVNAHRGHRTEAENRSAARYDLRKFTAMPSIEGTS